MYTLVHFASPQLLHSDPTPSVNPRSGWEIIGCDIVFLLYPDFKCVLPKVRRKELSEGQLRIQPAAKRCYHNNFHSPSRRTWMILHTPENSSSARLKFQAGLVLMCAQSFR